MESPVNPNQRHATDLAHAPCLVWLAGTTVILVHREKECMVVARGWREDDRLTHVRRWNFQDSRAVVGQVRRLVRDGGSCESAVEEAAATVLAWLSAGQ